MEDLLFKKPACEKAVHKTHEHYPYRHKQQRSLIAPQLPEDGSSEQLLYKQKTSYAAASLYAAMSDRRVLIWADFGGNKKNIAVCSPIDSFINLD